jgi:hypothetical protein
MELEKVPAAAFANRNVIYVGGRIRPTGYVQKVLEKANFHLTDTVFPSRVESRRPEPGTPAYFEEVLYSQNRRNSPGILLQFPPNQNGSRTVLLVGAFPTIVVLLFRLFRPDEEISFLEGARPEAITASLSSVRSVVVRSNVAALRFAESPDFGRVARELDVDHVLTGTVN